MKMIDEIKDEVCFEFGHINFSNFTKNVFDGNIHKLEFIEIIDTIAKRYSREAERYYNENNWLEK